jgi:acetyl-CoA carboxylase biotin carboxyl carrier protein
MPAAGNGPDDAGLIELIDRLEALLNASELSELEIEAGDTTLVLRKPGALAQGAAPAAAVPADGAAGVPSWPADGEAPADQRPAQVPVSAVLAPLTGLFYLAPSPGAEPYVRAGANVAVGQVIGLIEAMKLFNEIKSDLAGRVVRICAENGALVKAKQPLIEVEP